ncbi:MAG: hypothetical protein GY944_29600 [bacterium]|nr:hypothetical protein [bacterium]
MSIEDARIQRLAVTQESLANFGADLSGSATYYDVPFQEGTAAVVLGRPAISPQYAMQHIDAHPLEILGPKSAQLTFTMALSATGDAAGDTVASPAVTDSSLLLILSTIFGGSDAANTGSTVASAASASVITATDGTGWNRNHGVGWTGSSGVVHFSEVRSVSGNILTLTTELPATPSASDVLYGATTIHPEDTNDTSLQFILEGAEQDSRWLLTGGQATTAPSISIGDSNAIPTISFTLTFTGWEQLSAQAITTASYDGYSPTYAHGEFRTKVSGSGSQARTLLDVASRSYTLNSPVYVPIKSPDAPQAGHTPQARWQRTRAVPFCETKFQVPYEDTTWMTARDNRTLYHCVDVIGSSAGGIVAIVQPTCQVVDVQPISVADLAYQEVTLRSTIDENASSSTGMREAAMRIHFA